MQVDESGSSQMLLTDQLSRRSQSPGPGETRVLARPPKLLRRTTIQTSANIEPEMEPDGQGHLDTVHLSDDSCDEYQNPSNPDETGLETELNADDSDISKGTTSGQPHASQASRNREKVSDLWCESQPPRDHRRYLSLDRTRKSSTHNPW